MNLIGLTLKTERRSTNCTNSELRAMLPGQSHIHIPQSPRGTGDTAKAKPTFPFAQEVEADGGGEQPGVVAPKPSQAFYPEVNSAIE
jgi:hypothetical protein